MTTDISAGSALGVKLRQHLPSARIFAGQAAEQVSSIWNGAVDHRPAVIVRPESPDEVQLAGCARPRRSAVGSGRWP
jgi:hypothetical protein